MAPLPVRPAPGTAPPVNPRQRRSGGLHRYGGNPGFADEAAEPGDRAQGSDGAPITGKA